eukprot:1288570-Lingulodinium_polyedra.AAC.1
MEPRVCRGRSVGSRFGEGLIRRRARRPPKGARLRRGLRPRGNGPPFVVLRVEIGRLVGHVWRAAGADELV